MNVHSGFIDGWRRRRLVTRSITLGLVVSVSALAAIVATVPGPDARAQGAPPTGSFYAASLLAGTDVELVRDVHGVPHVFAPDIESGFYGVGWASAEDRLFQMEISRRMMRGRLAEILDEADYARVVELDKRARLLGWKDHAVTVAGNLPNETKLVLDAYAKGVNDHVASLASLPQPFADAGITTWDPWTPEDSLLMWWRVQDPFDGGWEKEPKATCGSGAPIVDGDGAVVPCPPATCDLGDPGCGGGSAAVTEGPCRPGDPACDNAPILTAAGVEAAIDEVVGTGSSDARAKGGAAAPSPGARRAIAIVEQPPEVTASHGWAVAGTHTSTGEAALHGDPQLFVHVPSAFHEVHLAVEGRFDARGVGVAGMPGLFLGFNENIAWTATAMGGEASDLYRLDTSAPAGRNQYILDGVVTDMTDVHREVVTKKDGTRVHVLHRDTVWGPVVTETLADFGKLAPTDTSQYALRRVMFDDVETHTVVGLLALMDASDWCSARAAIEDYRGPGIHFLYADHAGHIGFQALTHTPVRPPNAPCWGNVPLDGSTTASDWGPTIPLDDLPWSFDPPEGFITIANNLAAEPCCVPHNLVLGFSGDTIRSWRITERLEGELAATGNRIDPATVLAIHKDAVQPGMRVFTELAKLMQAAGHFTPGSDADLAITELATWNQSLPPEEHYSMFTDLDAWPLIEATEAAMMANFRFPPVVLAQTFGGGVTGVANFLKTVEQDYAPWVNDTDAIDWVTFVLGEGWANRGTPSNPRHDLLYQAHLTPLCGLPTAKGQTCSVNPAYDFTSGRPLKVTAGNTVWSQRGNTFSHFIDFSAIGTGAKSMITPGTSDVPGTRFFKNNEGNWITGTLNPAPLDRSAIDVHSITNLVYP